MKTFDIALPNNNSLTSKSKNSFSWSENQNETVADQCNVEERENDTGKILYIWGSNGALNDGTYRAHQMFIPFPQTDLNKKEYTSGDTLKFHYLHVTKVTPDHIYIRMVEADEANLRLTLDLAQGTAAGSFNAHFNTGYDLHPAGEFKMALELRAKN
ncbi:hypothetical protein C5612_00190 [Pseudomonas frederiksbergensis]|uniref:Uncharacterized protein n=1 Tax=Pseudomonas frederiksbergensis TaxID=104087 RepID=A0A2S8HUS0_9PSED|nr:hypothetical protein [Pseudomonas frederiksbergensis]PQP06221.1 hypothetical protein C5612_00190 [Pseudomonas frederiksbergensis]